MLATGPAMLVHTAFEWLAIAVGAQIYRRASARTELAAEARTGQRLGILLGAVLGAAIGNKLAFFLYEPQALQQLASARGLLLGGQSVVGGLLGGLLGVEAAKRLVRFRSSTGDTFVAPILVGIIIGRCGCFLAGLQDMTYGDPTTLPWGYDFGDGVRRHPTQIYDQLFAAALLVALIAARPRLEAVPGLQFKLMLTAYLSWRLLIDSIKPVPFAYPANLSGIQLLCVIALLVYLPVVLRAARPLVRSWSES